MTKEKTPLTEAEKRKAANMSRYDTLKDDIEYKVEDKHKEINIIIDSIDYGFEWVENKRFDPPFWYKFDNKVAAYAAELDAKKIVSYLKKNNYETKKKTRSGYIKRGGIGTNRPEIDLYVNIITITAKLQEEMYEYTYSSPREKYSSRMKCKKNIIVLKKGKDTSLIAIKFTDDEVVRMSENKDVIDVSVKEIEGETYAVFKVRNKGKKTECGY